MKPSNLAALNDQAEKRGARPIPAPATPSRDQLWAPMALAPLSYLPSFALLTERQKLRYNQLFALGLLEQFIWFEEHLICPILARVELETGSEMQTAIDHFVREERRHSAMFWSLLRAAEPDFYRHEQFHLLKLRIWQRFAMGIMIRFPKRFIAWSWLTVFFEERTLYFSRKYHEAKADVAASFVEVHWRHLQDETAHVQMDSHFIAEFFNSSSHSSRRHAGRMMLAILRAFASPRRVSTSILKVMKREFADLHPKTIEKLKHEMRTLKTNSDYHRQLFGEPATKRTRELLAQEPAMTTAYQFLKTMAAD